ncbi:10477_t:CDS:2 [Funneliformis mosseae]|uniref:10477_t:CDS:1 n=1 Tax=Funneliformis mosseae TaxID=27381 RepID=A0A9N9H7A7_FUNMO|nr:10477_t:CDS:2 [Funneliformis mosseae]
MISLHSCLLVNKDWSEIAVEKLWRDIYIIQARANEIYGIDLEDESDQNILSTLYSCLTKESQELLKRNEIMIDSSTIGSPKYNYPKYCKFLDTGYINQLIIVHLGEQSEIMKHFPSIFCGMAQLCRNIDKLLIKWVKEDNEGLTKLIEVQNNLRQVGLELNSLSHLYIKNSLFCIPLLSISKLTRLTSLELNFEEIFPIALLESLCSIHFPNLTKLLIGENIPPLTLLTNFIKTNGKTLKEFLLYNGFSDGDPDDCTILNQMISRFCSEFEILITFCHDEQFHDIKDILISCEKLDSLILRNSTQDKIDATYLFTTLLAIAPQYNLSRICVDSSIQFTYIILSSFLDIMNKKKHLLFHIYKSGGIRYVGYDGITNDHLAIIEKVGGGVLDDIDIMNEFSTTPQFRNPYRYSLE